MADDVDDDELSAEERRALAAYDAPEPPAGFVDRVIDGAPAAPVQATKPRRWIAGALVAAAVVGAAATITVIATRGSANAGSIVASDARRSVAIGDRAIVVTEPGTTIAWTEQADGATRAEQPSGNGFYRVDHGGPFVVATPLGDVRVTGTCFRVEVIMKPSKQSLFGGAVGAAIAAALVVTVYEGGVVVAGRHGGSSTPIAAGDRATITADGAPTVASATNPTITSPTTPATPVAIAKPPVDITREQLLARDEAQRQQITALSTRVVDLEKMITEHRGDIEPDGRPWYDPSPERLAEFAKNCEIRLDMPPLLGSEVFALSAEGAAEWGIDEAQRATTSETLAKLQREFADKIRAVYLDVIGEGANQDLSAQAMIQEIQDKSPPGEASAVKARIAQERAGLAKAPADYSKASAVERMFRLMAALGDDTESALGSKLGAEAAHAMRVKNGGWGNKWSMSGCDDKR